MKKVYSNLFSWKYKIELKQTPMAANLMQFWSHERFLSECLKDGEDASPLARNGRIWDTYINLCKYSRTKLS